MPNIVNFTQTLNVLIVEDDEVIRTQLLKILSRRFNNVDEASNGEEAYDKYKNSLKSHETKYDVIFSDLSMPIMDGLELLKKIRKEDKETTVVFISARNESHLLLEAISYGVNGYLIKPINYDLMTLKIREISTILYYKSLYEQKEQECEYYLQMLNNQPTKSKGKSHLSMALSS